MNKDLGHARDVIREIVRANREGEISSAGYTAMASLAGAHATLALAYEQRTANLIAMIDRAHRPTSELDQIAAEVRERLGLK